MLKLARRARGHFVTLIEIRVHLIRVKPGHISLSPDGHQQCTAASSQMRSVVWRYDFWRLENHSGPILFRP